ncbi:uncharacterized protein MONBRDRAFT_20327, partial [Monosiga brevicollis MX1]
MDHNLRLLDLFRELDNGHDKIRCKDFDSALMRLGHQVQPEHLRVIIETLDYNSNGEIEYAEFKRIFDALRRVMKNDQLRVLDLFRELDDGNGTINGKSFAAALERLGHPLPAPQLKLVLKELDDDGNGNIDYREFKTAF